MVWQDLKQDHKGALQHILWKVENVFANKWNLLTMFPWKIYCNASCMKQVMGNEMLLPLHHRNVPSFSLFKLCSKWWRCTCMKRCSLCSVCHPDNLLYRHNLTIVLRLAVASPYLRSHFSVLRYQSPPQDGWTASSVIKFLQSCFCSMHCLVIMSK